VVDCVYDSQTSSIVVQSSWNAADSNQPLSNVRIIVRKYYYYRLHRKLVYFYDREEQASFSRNSSSHNDRSSPGSFVCLFVYL